MMKYKSPTQLGLIIPIVVMIFNVFVIFYPEEIIGASREGLSLWFNNVFPSLLPFIIGANILNGLGFVTFLGTLLEPLMYPLFGVPGSGGFAFISGLISGYPVGAKITADLRIKNEITKDEAQRLLTFTNNSGPLFILGVVGVSMFKNEAIGYFIMLLHYLAAIITGLLFKNYKNTKVRTKTKNIRLMSRAYHNMNLTRQKDGRSFGQILSDSVRNSMETIVQVGGFIILFCVLVKVLQLTNFVTLTEHILSPLLNTLGISEEIYEGIFIGLIEMTNGTKTLAGIGSGMPEIIASAALISFGGFSIHAQSVNFLCKTDISIPFYIFAKSINSIITILLGFLIYPFFNFEESFVIETFISYDSTVWDKLMFSLAGFFISFGFILFLILLILIFNTIKKNHTRA